LYHSSLLSLVSIVQHWNSYLILTFTGHETVIHARAHQLPCPEPFPPLAEVVEAEFPGCQGVIFLAGSQLVHNNNIASLNFVSL